MQDERSAFQRVYIGFPLYRLTMTPPYSKITSTSDLGKGGVTVDTAVRAIETTGIIDEKSHLQLDAPLPVVGPSRVRIIVLFSEEGQEEIEELAWLQAATRNPAFDFLKDPGEDIYTLADGRPFDDKR
jgi:hypothetical protein